MEPDRADFGYFSNCPIVFPKENDDQVLTGAVPCCPPFPYFWQYQTGHLLHSTGLLFGKIVWFGTVLFQIVVPLSSFAETVSISQTQSPVGTKVKIEVSVPIPLLPLKDWQERFAFGGSIMRSPTF